MLNKTVGCIVTDYHVTNRGSSIEYMVLIYYAKHATGFSITVMCEDNQIVLFDVAYGIYDEENETLDKLSENPQIGHSSPGNIFNIDGMSDFVKQHYSELTDEMKMALARALLT